MRRGWQHRISGKTIGCFTAKCGFHDIMSNGDGRCIAARSRWELGAKALFDRALNDIHLETNTPKE